MSPPKTSQPQIRRTISLADKRVKAAAFRADALTGIASDIAPFRLGVDRLLPTHEAIAPLFSAGALRRGSVVSIDGDRGATSLGLCLLQTPAQFGAWVALIDTPDLGVLAASELGLPLGRCVAVSLCDGTSWIKVLGATLGAFELVMTRPSQRVSQSELRPLLARLRKEGSVLVQLPRRNASFGVPADVHLEVRKVAWKGLYSGTGRLISRKLEVQATGKGAVGEQRSACFWLPSAEGSISAFPQTQTERRIRAVS